MNKSPVKRRGVGSSASSARNNNNGTTGGGTTNGGSGGYLQSSSSASPSSSWEAAPPDDSMLIRSVTSNGSSNGGCGGGGHSFDNDGRENNGRGGEEEQPKVHTGASKRLYITMKERFHSVVLRDRGGGGGGGDGGKRKRNRKKGEAQVVGRVTTGGGSYYSSTTTVFWLVVAAASVSFVLMVHRYYHVSTNTDYSGGGGRRRTNDGARHVVINRRQGEQQRYLPPSISRQSFHSPSVPLFLNNIISDDSKRLLPLLPQPRKRLKNKEEDAVDNGGILLAKNYRMGKPRQIIIDHVVGDVYDPKRDMPKQKHLGHYYAFDDDYRKGLNEVTEEHTCRRASFHREHHPQCNWFHELDIIEEEGKYLGHGHFRVVWTVHASGEDDPMVLKMQRSKKHEFDHDFFEMVRVDAFVMAAMTHSPRIVDIYSHCAASVATEQMAEEVEEFVVPGDGYVKQSELEEEEERDGDVHPRNSFTATEKLSIALQMAESIADLHGYEKGVIVHDDIQLCQWLRRRGDGRLKLNDFNRAEVMMWDVKQEEYCRYHNGHVYGNYRSPEEDADKPLNEQIDVYSMGNNIYALLTGLWNYYENEDDEVVQTKVKAGELPYIDPRYSKRSYPEAALVTILKKCWIHDPDKRATIFEVVDFLRAATAENNRLKDEKRKKRKFEAMKKKKKEEREQEEEEEEEQ